MLDGEAAMTTFLNLIAAEPDIAARADHGRQLEVVGDRGGLKCVQGKAIVNSISLKEGEAEFLRQARLRPPLRRRRGRDGVRRGGPGRRPSTRKVAICQRAYKLLTEKVGFAAEDIIFDPNILDRRHRHRGAQQLRASTSSRPTRQHQGDAARARKISRRRAATSRSRSAATTSVREAMHAAFLYHAIQAGLDMGIVNAGQLAVYEEIPTELLERVEDVLLNRRPDATERLVEFAETVKGRRRRSARSDLAWREAPVEERLTHALVKGIVDFIDADAEEARQKYGRPLDDHRRPADGRHERRRRPVRRRQDVPAAGGEERPRDEEGRRLPDAVHGSGEGGRRRAHQARGKMLMATVKGDVHDIGKNIVGVVLGCNNYEVIDLGVMVPCDEDPGDGARERASTSIGLSRPDHAVARRDGPRRPRDGAARASACRC